MAILLVPAAGTAVAKPLLAALLLTLKSVAVVLLSGLDSGTASGENGDGGPGS